eukprot:3936183-Rhodomonas_salina.1
MAVWKSHAPSSCPSVVLSYPAPHSPVQSHVILRYPTLSPANDVLPDATLTVSRGPFICLRYWRRRMHNSVTWNVGGLLELDVAAEDARDRHEVVCLAHRTPAEREAVSYTHLRAHETEADL